MAAVLSAVKDVVLPPSPPSSDSAEPQLPAYLLAPPTVIPTETLDVDKSTPDSHVPRDPRLIRLTGTHPFNVEAPLTPLYDAGFLTPPELFYVRNHGGVPKDLEPEGWMVSIDGLVENPIILPLEQITEQLPQITMPITLVCAGNRRKEQNMVRKGSGFNWGAAGVSTSLFTGPLLWEAIKLAKPKKEAKHVCMEGTDNLPQGHYGTSVKLSWVKNPSRGIMLAHKMNGEKLREDHGKPIRVVIPGVIGGRSVKWLKRIILTAEPSDNYYHIYDNRVLPTIVTPEMAKNDKKWWQDERYAIYDLNVQSAICYPQHDEILPVSDLDAQINSVYTVKGYAYNGGGRRITRIEVSLDKGRTWRLSEIRYFEDEYREFNGQELYGGTITLDDDRCWSWCFWECDVSINELASIADRGEILVRAMDESMNVQQRDMYWSVMSMMNNCWFRVAVRKCEGGIRFEHPTQPALAPGGWMERVKNAGGDLQDPNWGEIDETLSEKPKQRIPLKKEEIVMINPEVKREITMEEVEANEKNAWFVVQNEVYDGTGFLKEHPGGAESIILASGADATDDFMAIHSESAKKMLVDYHIGTLVSRDDDGSPQKVGEPAPTAVPRAHFLHPKQWLKSKLVSRTEVSSDSRVFTFELEHPEQTLGLPIGQHLFVRLETASGEKVVRAYTPVSDPNMKGKFELLVKVYMATDNMEGGKMTTLFEDMKIGDTVDCKGPLGSFEYLGKGRLRWRGVERQVKSFAMLAGGSGITPIFQVLRAVLEDPYDETTCQVIYSNRTEEDILCREILDQWMEEHGVKNRVKIHHTLSKPSEDWKHGRGRIGMDLMKEQLCEANENECVMLLCGPGGMQETVRTSASKLGWNVEKDLVIF
ncbi:hypothetical protein YB2330_002507 [Saitoella coloradoensis]